MENTSMSYGYKASTCAYILLFIFFRGGIRYKMYSGYGTKANHFVPPKHWRKRKVRFTRTPGSYDLLLFIYCLSITIRYTQEQANLVLSSVKSSLLFFQTGPQSLTFFLSHLFLCDLSNCHTVLYDEFHNR